MWWKESKVWGCQLMNIYQLQFRLYAASPRHKALAQMLQLWAFRFYPSRIGHRTKGKILKGGYYNIMQNIIGQNRQSLWKPGNQPIGKLVYQFKRNITIV